MTHTILQNPAAPKDACIIKFTMLLGGVVFLLMMVFGLIMRAAQGGLIDLDPLLFYQLDPVIIALGLFLLAGVLTANTVANDISGALIP